MSTSVRLGLILFGLLSVGDIVALGLTDGSHPPYLVAAVSTVLGLVSLYFVVTAWRGNHNALRPLLVLRILSALTAAPAFFVSDAPGAAVAAAAAIILLTGVGVLLVAPARSREAVTR
jgi:O-antigen/teichoic acid export membrane protein